MMTSTAAVEAEEEEEEADGGGGYSSSDVVLWCRRYRPETKAFSPYVCFGRVGYRSHEPGSQPLAFVWDLLDYDGLRFSSDATVRETFELFTNRGGF